MAKQQIGVIGLAVMGKNLALNIESRGFTVSLYNRSREKTDEMLRLHSDKHLFGAFSLEDFVASLECPRKIMIMVQAGTGTDAVIDQLAPLLDQGDLIIDGGNAFYQDTQRRSEKLHGMGLNFLGVGISGGEEGALHGPAVMPGGSKEAYGWVQPLFEAISAKVADEPCCTYIGPGGAGHYVKMVHNGIEYADMQLISEAYHLFSAALHLDAKAFNQLFTEWNTGELDSYLIEITADIFTKVDAETGKPLIDVILDAARQKGTGKWTSQSALDLGVPLSLITEAVFSRFLSSQKEERVAAAKLIHGPTVAPVTDTAGFIEDVRRALYASKICSYAQGFAQLKVASDEYGWNLAYGEIAKIFRGGCIIRARFLQNISAAYQRDPGLTNLMLDSFFGDKLQTYQDAWRRVIAFAVTNGIPVPSFSAALSYFDSYRTERLPANLVQAQRDFFGAHTFERVDRPGSFHFEWSE